jgi:hypothetical protein
MSNTRVGFEMRTEGQAVFMTRVEGGPHSPRAKGGVCPNRQREGRRARNKCWS